MNVRNMHGAKIKIIDMQFWETVFAVIGSK
jgi:hypothetical protein